MLKYGTPKPRSLPPNQPLPSHFADPVRSWVVAAIEDSNPHSEVSFLTVLRLGLKVIMECNSLWYWDVM